MENVNVSVKPSFLTVISFMVTTIVLYLLSYYSIDLLGYLLGNTSFSWVNMYVFSYVQPLLAIFLAYKFIKKYQVVAANIEQLVADEKTAYIDNYMHEAVSKFGLKSIGSIRHALKKGRKLALVMLTLMLLTYVVLILSVFGILFLPIILMVSFPIIMLCIKMLKSYKYMNEAIDEDPHFIDRYTK
ncbi:hypothetical protein [Shewanella sp. SM96]|uniref:hypothetical protein n=1 Tax=Shewanella TaxID=22 RepID=UPI0021D8C1F3|nr:hypothetical protein [Shewanella sp. SM96]MCU8005408.1 hypothetical protein [Shewanella sp. SM96]